MGGVLDRPGPTVGVVIPVLNETSRLDACLQALTRTPAFHEIIVVDGGSEDDMRQVFGRVLQACGHTAPRVVRLLQAPRGRALQMNAGAVQARSDVLLFLHADTLLPEAAAERVRAAIKGGELWGRFDVRIGANHFLFRIIERFMNLRSMISGIATGDQAIFVRRDVFNMLAGYPPVALMEDVEFCRRLKWVGRPARIRDVVTTSARRWQRNGIIRTIILMWSLRFLYWLGVSPERLARVYHKSR